MLVMLFMRSGSVTSADKAIGKLEMNIPAISETTAMHGEGGPIYDRPTNHSVQPNRPLCHAEWMALTSSLHQDQDVLESRRSSGFRTMERAIERTTQKVTSTVSNSTALSQIGDGSAPPTPQPTMRLVYGSEISRLDQKFQRRYMEFGDQDIVQFHSPP